MSKSFDDKIEGRLSGYSSTPAPNSKEAIFAKLDSGNSTFTWIYHYLGGGLLLLSVFMMGRISNEPANALKSTEMVSQRPSQTDSNNIKNFSSAHDKAEVSAASSLVTIENHPSIELIDHQNEHLESENAIVVDNQEIEEYTIIDKTMDFNGLSRVGYSSNVIPVETNLIVLEKEQGIEKIIPTKEKFLKPYFELGSFFMYNRLKPNLTDDIYIADFDSPFGMSISRFGLGASVGFERQWNEKLSTRLGLLFNNYNQSYSFTIRETKPDSVIVSNEFVEPVFNRDTVQINKRVSTLGMKFQSTWNFPSSYNSLFVSMEYHRRISDGPSLSYDGQIYELSSRNQYLLELGLRKKLFELKNGDFFVIPGIRYALTRWKSDQIIDVKPFSVGVSLNYTLK